MPKKNLLKVKNLTKTYGGMAVVDCVSFDIQEGDIVAMIGPNGAGKSTLAKLLMGLIEPTEGSVKINNQNPNKVRRYVGYVPQKFHFNHSIPMTVEEFLNLSIHNLENKKDKKESVIEDRLNDVGLKDVLKKQISDLSGGQMQRVLIARALLVEKKLLLLDEPVASIDVEGKQSIYQLLKEINKKHKVTIIIISHELDVVFKYADQVLCINRRMLCQGTPKETLTQKVLGEIYGMEHQAHYHHTCEGHDENHK